MNYISQLITKYPVLASIEENIHTALNMLDIAIRGGNKILLCGNGGSAADAEHICGELMKGFLLRRELSTEQTQAFIEQYSDEGALLAQGLQQAIPAISLVSGVALPTAYANDVAAENIFAQQVWGLGNKGDVLWVLSTSGNSKNVIQAIKVAHVKGLKVLGMTGQGGGEMCDLCHVLLDVPSHCTPEIQELHLPIYHALCAELEARLFSSGN